MSCIKLYIIWQNYESQINGFDGIEFNAYSIDCGYSSPKFSTIDMFKLAM